MPSAFCLPGLLWLPGFLVFAPSWRRGPRWAVEAMDACQPHRRFILGLHSASNRAQLRASLDAEGIALQVLRGARAGAIANVAKAMFPG